MDNTKIIRWILRIAVFGEFLGHGIFAVSGKPEWAGWVSKLTGVDTALAIKFLFLIGLLDITVALIILLRPIRVIILWATFWGFWTALMRPIVGEPIWDFVERWANWAAPLALLLLIGWPKSWREWLK